MDKTSVLFVCLGNICRSPTAHAVFRHTVGVAGLSHRFLIDSAGTSAFHSGSQPDARSAAEGRSRGIDMSDLRSRPVTLDDFEQFDWVIAMDFTNLADLKRMKPDDAHAQLGLMLDYSTDFKGQPVPDPYYGGAQGFKTVYDQIEQACVGLLASLTTAKK